MRSCPRISQSSKTGVRLQLQQPGKNLQISGRAWARPQTGPLARSALALGTGLLTDSILVQIAGHLVSVITDSGAKSAKEVANSPVTELLSVSASPVMARGGFVNLGLGFVKLVMAKGWSNEKQNHITFAPNAKVRGSFQCGTRFFQKVC